jgi:hypothetical protein
MRGRPFQPGNTAGCGRPKGARNKINQVLQDILDQHSEGVLRKTVILALQGNGLALRLLLERIMPARREALIRINLPATRSMADIDKAHDVVLQCIAAGQITPGEGETLSRILEARRLMIESVEFEAKIASLEAAQAKEGKVNNDATT